MTLSPYTLDDLARDLSRTHAWASRNWRGLVKSGALPRPLAEAGPPVWDRAHVYAVRDKRLSPADRVHAAAIRAAYDAAHNLPGTAAYADEVAESRRKLDRRFGAGAAAADQAKRGPA